MGEIDRDALGDYFNRFPMSKEVFVAKDSKKLFHTATAAESQLGSKEYVKISRLVGLALQTKNTLGTDGTLGTEGTENTEAEAFIKGEGDIAALDYTLMKQYCIDLGLDVQTTNAKKEVLQAALAEARDKAKEDK